MNRFYQPIYLNQQKLPFFVNCIGGMTNQNHVNRPEGYHAHQWLFCKTGKGQLVVEDQSYLIEPGMSFSMPKGMAHEYYALEEPWGMDFIAYEGPGADAIAHGYDFDVFILTRLVGSGKIDVVLEELFHIGEKNQAYLGMEMCAKLLKLLTLIRRSMPDEDENSMTRAAIHTEKGMGYMERYFDKELTLDDMADEVGISKQQFCNVFKEQSGIRPYEYLNQVRIEKAKWLLLNNPEKSVNEIGEKVGFRSPSYFGLVFKKAEGLSPGKYRQHNMYESR